jgi:hypothetical protein
LISGRGRGYLLHSIQTGSGTQLGIHSSTHPSIHHIEDLSVNGKIILKSEERGWEGINCYDVIQGWVGGRLLLMR